jgi:pentatricopeptide repeat protein
MENSGISPNKVVLTSLIKAYGKVNCWKEAQEMYSRMKNMDGGPDIIASNALLYLYANLGMVTTTTTTTTKPFSPKQVGVG